MRNSSTRLLAQVMLDLAASQAPRPSIAEFLDRLVRRIAEILPVAGAAITVTARADHPARHHISATGGLTATIRVLADELRAGPQEHACRTGQPVTIPNLQADTRFLPLTDRARTAGLAAVFTFPLRHDGDCLGTLELYRDTPGPLPPDDTTAVQALAAVTAGYLLTAETRTPSLPTLTLPTADVRHDPLTGLPNRTHLADLLTQAIARAKRSHHPTAVLAASLDSFKSINGRYGREIGDQVLTAAAHRLSQALRPGDTLARVGGDEFVALCENLPTRAEAETIAQRLVTVMAAPFTAVDHQIPVTVSVGVASSGPGQDTPDILLRDADYAMRQAKRAGGARTQAIDPAARAAADQLDQLDLDLRQAARGLQLALAYQPIIDIRTGTLTAAEALLRWHHPHHGTVPPAVAILSAERTGLIQSLGEWVLRRACQDLQLWNSTGTAVPAVAVNVSPHQITAPGFARTVHQVLHDTGADPTAVCLEITESVFLADAPRALAVMRDVRDLGVTLSLDDFGTGYSSLSYLRQFPFDTVKIDQTFTAALPAHQATRSIVAAIIDLSHALDLTVTAEGVETADQLVQIGTLGADHAQGFHLSRPLPPTELATFAAANR